MGSWEWTIETDSLIWSDNAFRLLGLQPGEIVPSPELVVKLTHPDDQERVRRHLQEARAGGGIRPFDYRIVRADREVRQLVSTVIAVEEQPRRLIGHVLDVTDRRHAERQIEAHTAVAEALGAWESLGRSGERLVSALGQAMEFVAGALWVPQTAVLAPRVFWQARAPDASRLEAHIRSRTLERGEGLPGRVWALGEPAGLASLSEEECSDHREVMAQAGVRGAVAFPALAGKEVVAVLKFYSREEFAATARLMRSLTGIGRELGHFLSLRRGELQPDVLTKRELQVLQLAARGATAPDIAEKLVISRDTVKTHLRNIYSKLEVNDKASAVAQALRLGLIE